MLNHNDLLLKDLGDWGKVLTVDEFMNDVESKLSEMDFNKNNSRLVFSVCPDDVNRLEEKETIENALTGAYNGEFHLGGLGAYPIGGVSGITAASHHPPDDKGNGERKEGNLVFFLSPHMGIMEKDESPVYGKIIRPGQTKITSSCGAMMGFLAALKDAGSVENFTIAPDDNTVDPTRIVLHNELINNYAGQLTQILGIEDYNKQVIELFKLNYDLVTKKALEMIEEFLEKEHFEGKISAISGITVNIPGKDLFVLKDFSFPKPN
ncbi:MAG: hypothetical protein BAJALOKI2v1_20068 [Promethearchaeota archaeon]|nr:MAG: hypothetical protein BAJALOKI2v1_20068 [Candidatus Lokiarchaeota archaeon]